MRILHFTTSLGGGGRERRMVQLIRGLYQQCTDCEQWVATISTHCDYLEIYDTPTHIVKVAYNPRYQFYKEMAQIIETFKPDIVHSWVGSHQDLVVLPLLKARYHFRYIVGHLANCVPITTFSFLCSIPSYICADAIVSNSRQGLIAKKAVFKKAHVIHNGFDFSRFTKEVDIRKKRKDLNIPENSFVINMCARFHPSKDWKSFVELAKLAREGDADMYFLAVGQGESLEEAQRQANNYNLQNILFLGQRKDVEEIMQISNASVLFTNSKVHAEGISNSLMESMAAGVPTIATYGGGTPELIDHNENGFLISDSDYQDAWRIILALKNDTKLKNRISYNARNHILHNFSLEIMTKKYLDLYKQTLG